MDEGTFDIFSGAPEENGVWLEAIEGLANARQLMGQIAACKPGKYFLFSRSSRSILTRINAIPALPAQLIAGRSPERDRLPSTTF